MAPVPLSQFLVCHGLSPAEIDRLAAALETKTFPPRTRILQQGDASEIALFIEDGTVAVRMTNQGVEVQLTTQVAGTIVGEIGLILSQPRAASVDAETEVRAGVLRRARFREWLEQGDPIAVALVLNVVRIQTQRLTDINVKFHELTRSVQDSQVRDELTAFRNKLFGEWSF